MRSFFVRVDAARLSRDTTPMLVRVDGVFVQGESGQLKHVSRHVAAELTEVEPGGPWRLDLHFNRNRPMAALVSVRCVTTVPHGSGVFEAGPSAEAGVEFAGTFFVVRGRIVVEVRGDAPGSSVARHEP